MRNIVNREGVYYKLELKEECRLCERERFIGLILEDRFVCSNCCLNIYLSLNGERK